MGKIITSNSFIKKSKKIHGDTYDYSLVRYVKTITPVVIICKEHGKFNQTPHNHLRGSGCPKCGRNRTEKSKKYTQEQFIQKAQEVHGDVYDYSKVNYTNSRTKVTIDCKYHGSFLLTPKKHLQKIGCHDCTHSSQYNIVIAERNKKELENIKAILYCVKIYNENEVFYKIGITVRSIKKRFSEISKNYKYNVEKLVHTNLYDAIHLETEVLNSNIEKYVPEIKFGGHTECFSKRPNI